MDIKQNLDTGFLPVENGDLVLVTGIDAIQQNITRNIRTILGELFRDVTRGVDYFNIIFQKGIREQTKASELKRAILNTPGVVRIEGFAFSVDSATRVASVTAQKIVVEGGEFPFNQDLGV